MSISSKDVDLNKLAEEIHVNNRAKGFWDGVDNPKDRITESLALIHSEVAEMLEAHRTGKFSPKDLELLEDDINFKEFFVDNIKSSMEDEFADIAIRVMDLAGALKSDLNFQTNIKLEYTSFFHFINIAHSLIAEAYNNQDDIDIYLKTILRTLFCSEAYLKTDLMKHIKLKITYNKLRPYKHGKNY